jgi:hypothetical protein
LAKAIPFSIKNNTVGGEGESTFQSSHELNEICTHTFGKTLNMDKTPTLIQVKERKRALRLNFPKFLLP